MFCVTEEFSFLDVVLHFLCLHVVSKAQRLLFNPTYSVIKCHVMILTSRVIILFKGYLISDGLIVLSYRCFYAVRL